MNDRSLIAVVAVTLLFGTAAPPTAAQTNEFISGQVTKVDASAGKITIKHGPIRKFEMEHGMTMVFRAAEPSMLKAVKPGDKIRFLPDRVDGEFTVIRIEKAK